MFISATDFSTTYPLKISKNQIDSLDPAIKEDVVNAVNKGVFYIRYEETPEYVIYKRIDRSCISKFTNNEEYLYQLYVNIGDEPYVPIKELDPNSVFPILETLGATATYNCINGFGSGTSSFMRKSLGLSICINSIIRLLKIYETLNISIIPGSDDECTKGLITFDEFNSSIDLSRDNNSNLLELVIIKKDKESIFYKL